MFIRVVPYDEGWPARYETEAQRLREALGDIVHEVHHIGSTAVPGLSAKPIIDILLEVCGLPELDARAPRLEFLGYDYLISHPQVARAYAEIKQQLEERFPYDIQAYMDGKDSFVKHYEADALAWRSSRTKGSRSTPGTRLGG